MMLSILCISWFLEILLIQSCVALVNRAKYNIFKRENGNFVLVRHGGHALDIPDLETIKELGFDGNNATLISDEQLLLFKRTEKVPSLKHANQWADEKMRVVADRIYAFDPANYWVESHYLIGHGTQLRSYNPSMLRLQNGRILFCWRSTDYDSQVLFGWYHLHNHTITPEPSIKIQNSVVLKGSKSPMQDDGRLIALNNTVIVTFSGVFDKLLIAQMYATGIYNEVTNTIDFAKDSSKMFKFPENQKNWTPFIYKNELHLFHSLNPVFVVKANGPDPSAVDDNNQNLLSVVTVSKLDKVLNLPWDGKLYGEHLRGGTPAIMLRGKLFSVFHTQTSFINGLFTYFMGAITFCPEPPFQIHSISAVPIIKKHLYDGPWDTKKINYVLYPMSAVVEDASEKHIYVSMGYQDKNGYLIKLEVDGLFDHMELVNHCDGGSGGGGEVSGNVSSTV